MAGRSPVPGFAALQVLPDASSKNIDGFLGAKIARETRFSPTAGVDIASSTKRVSSQEEPAHALFPWVHISLLNLKRCHNHPRRRQ